MKRLLTYGLLLLTILASHFIVSACQDDSDKTTIIMTFTTRVENPPLNTTTGEDVEVPQEAMKELRIIMAREDGTVVVNQKDPNVDANPYSLQFNVPMTAYTEKFQFVVIANESTLVSSDGNAIDLASIDDKDEFNNLKTCVIGLDGFSLDDSQYIPQTIYWAQDITYGETTNISKQLLFVVSKITVEFKNETQEQQSLSDIHIKGIIPGTQGYLLKQDGTDFVGTQHDASAMQNADIIFNAVTDLGAGTSSVIQHYYTYPVSTDGIASSTSTFTQSGETYQQPTLFATWNGTEYNLPITEVTDEDGNKRAFTSLARNERLKIIITLTPAGDITVNYTIDEWEDAPTTIGGEAPTTTPDNNYNTQDWGASNDIEIGGGSNNIWDLGNGTTIKGEEVNTGWSQQINAGGNDILTLTLPGDDIYALEGYYIFIEFRCQTNNGHNNFDIWFITDWGENHVISKKNADGKSYTWNENQMIVGENGQKIPNEDVDPYVRYMLLDKTALDMIYNYSNSKNKIITTTRPPEPDENGKYEQLPIHVFIETLTLIKPTTYSN